MIVFLNGQFVPEEQALVSVFDRGFLYGDGLFETLRVYNGKPFRWAQHVERLRRGAEFLGIRTPYLPSELLEHAEELIKRNRLAEALLRVSLSRGIGIRGYAPKGANSPTLVLMLHPAPALDAAAPFRWRVISSSFRVPEGEKLALFKTCNKLPQILARAEAQAHGSDEALLLNTSGQMAEGASSNIFWIEDATVCTTPIESGILAGVTREIVLELCASLAIRTEQKPATLETLRSGSGLFLTLSSLEVVEVVTLNEIPMARSPIVQRLYGAYRETVRRETA